MHIQSLTLVLIGLKEKEVSFLDKFLFQLTICPCYINLIAMAFFKRTLSIEFKKLAHQYPIVALMGPRQSGKTTLAKTCFPHFKYTSLEDLDVRTYATEDPRGFLADHQNGTIIDEIQRVPDLFPYLQTEVDKTNKPAQFILTGSQNFLLLQNITQSLAGRVALLKLLPLSFTELQAEYKIPENIAELIFKGFYPKLYSSEISPAIWQSNYIQTYIERDIRLIKNITDLNRFQTFLKLCANRIGQLLNLTSIANECGINHNTAKSWLSLLEASFIVHFLRPYHKNFNKRLVKMPKLYFYDTGIVSHLLGVKNADQINTHVMKGALFENFIISELLKEEYNKNLVPDLYFWRDKTGNEIDCLIEKPNHLILVEIKSGKTITSDFFKGFEYWDKISHTVTRKYLVYGGKENQHRTLATVLSWEEIGTLLNEE